MGLIDLHTHLGGAVAPHIMWSIAHKQGLRLPVKTYEKFVELVTARPGKVDSLDSYLAIMHKWTEKIQSSPAAMEKCVYETISEEYRRGVRQMELRFNPMKRNRNGEQDMDRIILAAIRGLERAKLEYACDPCLIFCLAREFPFELNQIIVEKAIHYRHYEGFHVRGIDVAGGEIHEMDFASYADLFSRARQHQLGITVHAGETDQMDEPTLWSLIEHLQPHRIGHGLRIAESPELMAMCVERHIIMEICPTSNLMTRAVRSLADLGRVLARFKEHGVEFTINTDGSHLLDTNLARERRLLLDAGILTDYDLDACDYSARSASFLAL